MADVVVPEAAVSRPTPLDPSVDRPEPLGRLLDWFGGAGLEPEVPWAKQDLVVLLGRRAAEAGPR